MKQLLTLTLIFTFALFSCDDPKKSNLKSAKNKKKQTNSSDQESKKYRTGLVYLRMKGLPENQQREFLDQLQERNLKTLSNKQEK